MRGKLPTKPPASGETPEERQHRLRWLALLSLGLGFMMTIVNVTVVNITTPTILGLSPVIYSIVLAVIPGLISYPNWFQRLRTEHRQPVFDIDLFKLKTFRGGIFTSFFRQAAQFAVAYGMST